MKLLIVIFFLNSFIIACAFKKEVTPPVAYVAPLIIKETTIPKLIPKAGLLNANTSLILSNDRSKQFITFSTVPDNRNTLLPLRKYLIKEAKKYSANLTQIFNFDERYLNIISINDFKYSDLVSARYSLNDLLSSGYIGMPGGASLDITYSLESIFDESFFKFEDIILSAYTFMNGNLVRIGGGPAISDNGKPSIILSDEFKSSQIPSTLKLTSLSSKLIKEIITNELPLFLGIDNYSTTSLLGSVDKYSSIVNTYLKTHSRVIVSTNNETKVFYPEVTMTLVDFIKKEYGSAELDIGKDFLLIGDIQSDLKITDLSDDSAENLNKGLWVTLFEGRTYPDELMEAGKTYAIVFATSSELNSSLKPRRTLISETLAHKDTESATQTIGKVRNGDTIEIAYSGNLKKPKLINTTVTGNYQRSRCTQAVIDRHYCRQIGGGREKSEIVCEDSEDRVFGADECERVFNDPNSHQRDQMSYTAFTCERYENFPYTCSASGNIPTYSPPNNFAYTEDSENLRLYLIVGKNEYKLSTSKDLFNIKGAENNLLFGSAKILIDDLPTDDEYNAYIEVRPDLDTEELPFSITSNSCPSDALGISLDSGLIHNQDMQSFNLKIDYLEKSF